MAPPLLHLRDIGLGFGGPPLLDGAELVVHAGERLALVGRNGSGKSSLLKIAAGMIEADSGERFVQPGTTLRYLPQEPDLSAHEDLRAYVLDGLAPGDDPQRAERLMLALDVDGAARPAQVSGGEARRAALARVLAPDPDILLLDEPTNHLDLPSIEWLEGELARLRGALVLISHDRRFLERLARRCLWLDRGQTRLLDKGFAHFEPWRDELLEQEKLAQHKLDRQIVREEHWLRYGVTARRKRNQGRLRALQELRRQRREARRATGQVSMTAAAASGGPKLVIEATGLAKGFDTRTIVSDLDLRLLRGDRLGIVGPNGAGKTTLIRLLIGELAPDAGAVRRAQSLELVTIDQKRESLDPNLSLRDALTGGGSDQVQVGNESRHVMSYLQDFLFTPSQAGTPIRELSGGERGRLMLARALARPSNLLVLDEPTNDLDLETLDLLQELLADYPGTLILVSHDRDFLDRVATSVLAAEGDGRWTDYAGGYSDMLSQRGADLGPAKPKPKAAKPLGKPAAPKPRPERRKLSFKQQQALKTLPGEIDKLAAEIARLEQSLADPGLYARDPAAFQRASGALQAAQARHTAAEEEWLELELLREEIEGA